MNPEPNPQVQQLLEQLHGIIEPQPSFALAFGWWLLLALTLLFIGFGALKLASWYRTRAYRVSARLLVNEIPVSATLAYAYALNQILKRTAISAYGRSKVAHLQGQAWVEFLMKTKRSAHFPSALQDLLNFGLYQSQHEFNPEQLKTFTLAWIGVHSAALAEQPREATGV